jgi:hypothetical protein
MTDATQDEPALAQNATTDQERLDGLVAQMHADLAGEDAEVVEQALRHRLDDIGLALDADEIAGVVARVAGR